MDRAYALLVLLILGCGASEEAPAEEPPRAPGAEHATLWVWHGATDLRGLHEASEGRIDVAYLARTLRVRPDGVFVRPRRSPLHLDDATERTAVVRIEVEPEVDAAALAVDALVAEIAPVLEERASGLQIDFDARRSERSFYARLLAALEGELPEGWTLEMTALGSWCLQDRWLAEVPVDRIVPMLFGPGHERELTFAALREGPLPEPRCRESHGVEEGQRSPRPPERLYVFPSDGPWTVERALRSLGPSSSAERASVSAAESS